ncbi:hypothetical protein HDZ31DRAFT_60709 [Schizophyllum fasciatum]
MGDYTEQINKQMVLENFEFEVEQRTEEMRRWLQLSIDQFRQHQENLIGRIPKHVRNMTLRELRDKYNGDMQAATIGGPMERLQAVGAREREELNKKRKWAEEDNEARKNARLHSPVKKPPSNVRRTPMRHATPHKPPFVPARNPSPTKPSLYNKQRVPSSSTFNPALNLPPKTPLYPGSTSRSGKPDAPMPPPSGTHTLKRVKSNILIRADPTHSRSGSQSETTAPLAKHNTVATMQTTTPLLDPSTVPTTTPRLARTRSVITLATTDGHVLEFDPLMNSPSDLDALEGITNSAKREARREMTRLVSATMEKWKIT